MSLQTKETRNVEQNSTIKIDQDENSTESYNYTDVVKTNCKGLLMQADFDAKNSNLDTTNTNNELHA